MCSAPFRSPRECSRFPSNPPSTDKELVHRVMHPHSREQPQGCCRCVCTRNTHCWGQHDCEQHSCCSSHCQATLISALDSAHPAPLLCWLSPPWISIHHFPRILFPHAIKFQRNELSYHPSADSAEGSLACSIRGWKALSMMS